MASLPLTRRELRRLPCFQARTTKHRQFVYLLSRPEEEMVIKGPFTEDKIQALQDRNKCLCGLFCENIIALENQIEIEGELYLLYHSIIIFSSKAKKSLIEHKESFSDLQYSIIDRKSYASELSKLSDGGYPSKWRDKELYQLVRTMVILYILGAGDTGPANIMHRKSDDTYHVIDYEMNRSSYSDDNPWFYFSKAPKKCPITEAMRGYYSKLAEELRGMKENILGILEEVYGEKNIREYQKRYKKALLLLEKHQDSSSFERTSTSTGERTSTSTSTSTSSRKRTSTSTSVSLEKRTPGKIRGKDLKWNGSLGEMKIIGGHAKNFTYSGLEFRLCISALQKYIRRGMIEKALMVANELYHVCYIETPQGKGCFTNFKNRLMIIAIEDIGPAHPKLLESVLDKVSGGQLDRSKVGDEKAYFNCMNLVERMARSPKTRICSHLRHQARQVLEDKGYDKLSHKELRRALRSLRKESETPVLERLVACVAIFHQMNALEKSYTKSEMSDSIIESGLTLTLLPESSSSSLPGEKLFALLKSAYLEYQARKRSSKRSMVSENLCYLITGFLLSNFRVLDENTPEPERIPATEIEYRRYRRFDYRLVIDEEYVNDKHVPGGNKDLNLFYLQGAQVENQHYGWFRQDWYDAYTHRTLEEEE